MNKSLIQIILAIASLIPFNAISQRLEGKIIFTKITHKNIEYYLELDDTTKNVGDLFIPSNLTCPYTFVGKSREVKDLKKHIKSFEGGPPTLLIQTDKKLITYSEIIPPDSMIQYPYECEDSMMDYAFPYSFENKQIKSFTFSDENRKYIKKGNGLIVVLETLNKKKNYVIIFKGKF